MKCKENWKRNCAFFLVIIMGMINTFFVSDLDCYASKSDATQNEKSANSDSNSTNQADDEQSTSQDTEVVKSQELDLGDYQAEMEVGGKQLLMVTVLPTTTTDKSLTYTSSNEEIATINGLGRIKAVSLGTTTITAKCGKVKESFELIVKEVQSTEEETIAVVDVEIGDYEEELEVDKTMNISATVLPATASDSTVSYSSNNNNVATVNSSGEVKGISQGSVTISVKAGNVEKYVTLKVKVSAVQLEINRTYLVLKPQGEFQLSAKAIPTESCQVITYKSRDESIASVSSAGKVTAKNKGNTTIIVSNGDISNAVTVIVNENGTKDNQEQQEGNGNLDEKTQKETCSVNEQKLLDLIDKGETTINVNAFDYEVITKNMLKKLYEKKSVLVISGLNYTITLKGEDIINYENELKTNIEIVNELSGKSFILNEHNNLPGNITLSFNEENFNKKFLYLYNESKNKYEMLGNEKFKEFELGESGKYLMIDNKISSLKVRITVVVLVLIILFGIFGGYITLKRKYWFW